MAKPLSREHRRFVIVDGIIGPAIVNFCLNAAAAWLVFRKLESVPLWGSPGIAIDTLVTAFVLPVLTALIAAWLVRVRVVRGKLAPIPTASLDSSRWSRRSSFMRGTLLGVAAVVFVATPAVILFALVGVERLPRASFVWFKASFAAGVGVLVTPPLGWWALVDASSRAER
ncbi:MAG TPA: hypothetical protein VGL86_24465 [Polyangia bacterium]|jgi:hypothetical protein